MPPLERELKLNMRGQDVEVLQKALVELGFALQDEPGLFGRTTLLAVLAFQKQNNLEASGVFDARTHERLVKVLGRDPFERQQDGDPPVPGQGLVVRGRVMQADGAPITGARLRAVRKGLTAAQDKALGEARSGEDGTYEIRVQGAGRGGIDLVVQVLAPDGDAVLTRSPLIVGAEGERVVDLVVSDPAYPPDTEFARVARQLDPLLRGADLDALDGDSISVLAGKTGLSPLTVTHYVQACRFASSDRVPAEAYYGLFRANLPVNKPALVAQDNAVLATALATAAQANVIAPGLGAEPEAVNKLVSALNQEVVDDLLKQPALRNGAASLGTFLDIAALNDDQKRSFVTLLQSHTGPARDFWEQLGEQPGFDDRARRSVQLTAQLGTLTLNHAPLMQRLQTRLQDADGDDPLRQLTSLTLDDWVSLVEQDRDEGGAVRVPPGLPQVEGQEPAKVYAQTMARMIEDAYPTATIAARLSGDEFEGAPVVTEFLAQHPTFEMRDMSVRQFVQANELQIPSDQLGALERVQRVFAIAPRFERYDAVRPLLERGVDSAYQIKTMGQQRFLRAFGDTIGEARAQYIYANAAQKTAVVTALYAKYGTEFNALEMAVLPGWDVFNVIDNLGPLFTLIDFPTWESLFGNIDFCKCEHCRSVFSPAAYLVALLKFLRDRSLLDDLSARRPDIVDLELNCHNTNTTLPYVDLVNEVLENFLASSAAVYQTEGEASDLRVHPEHLNPDAYTLLETRAYPWVLPFSLWTEEARAYLKPLNVARHELLDVLNPTAAADRDVAAWLSIAAEHLGLTPAERDLILDATFDAAHWDNRSVGSLRTVQTLLDTARIPFLELRQLLGTRFVNGDGALAIDYSVGEGDDSEIACDLSEARIDALGQAHLNRIERFVRLRRKLGWTVHELDAVLHALGGDLDEAALVNLSFVKRLHEQLDTDLLIIASWVADLDTRAYLGDDDADHPSYYASLFLNRTVGGADEVAVFEPGALGGAVIDDHQAAILAALQIITAEELALIRTRRLTDDSLSLANLSEMHRVATLKRALRISVRDLLDLLDLTGLDPFNAATLYDALRLSDLLDTIDAAGFSLAELVYLLRHRVEQPARFVPTERGIAVFLTGLRTGLQQIRGNFRAAPDPTGEITAQMLSAVVPAEDLPQVVALLYGVAPASELPADPTAFLNTHFAAFLPDATARAGVIARLLDDTDTGFLQPEAQQAERFALVLEPLAAHLRAISSVALVQQTFADFLDVELGVSDLLLGGLMRSVADAAQPASSLFLADAFLDSSGEITEAAFADEFAMVRRLHKTALLLNRLRVPAEELAFLFAERATYGWLDFNALPLSEADSPAPFDTWRRMAELALLEEALPAGETSVFDLLRMAEAGGDASAFDAFLGALAERTRWDRNDLDTLLDSAHFGLDDFDADWGGADTLEHLQRLQAAFRLLKQLGVPAGMAWGWTAPAVTREMAADVKQAARAKYSATQWLSVAEPIRDALREQQRVALVEATIQELNDPAIRDTNDLYAHFLMDVEMAPCMLTSRVVFATGAVQLFIQRLLLNLEDGLSLSNQDAEMWKWMKNYRVWEANVKVFITPENYIEPELRPEKSAFFQALEDELLQNEITLETAENAYLNYLEKLDEVARLEVVGAYNENDTDTLHVIARTKGVPHKYFYRRWFEGRRWTPWQEIPLEIDAEAVTPVIYNRRLYIFWLMTQELAEEEVPGGDNGRAPNRYLQIKLAWSQYRQRKWTAKRVSDVYLETIRTRSKTTQTIHPDAYRPRPIIRPNGDLLIAVERSYRDQNEETFLDSKGLYSHSGFLFVNDGQIELDWYDPARAKAAKNTELRLPIRRSGSWTYYYSSDGVEGLQVRGADGSWQKVLAAVPHPFRVTIPLQYTSYDSSAPFFFEDKYRTYFVQARNIFGPRPRYTGDLTLELNPNVYLELDDIIRVDNIGLGVLLGSGPVPLPDPDDGPVILPVDGLDGGTVLPGIGGGLLLPTEMADAVYYIGTYFDTSAALNIVDTPGAVLGGDVRVAFERIGTGGAFGAAGTSPALNVGTAQPVIGGGASPIHRAGTRALPMTTTAAEGLQYTLRAAELQIATAVMDVAVTQGVWVLDWALFHRSTYTFQSFYHPYVPVLIKQLNRYGVEGILNPREHGEAHALRRQLMREPSNREFADIYDLGPRINGEDLPAEEFDFEYGTPYAIYNWELFFHIPFMIANHLSQNQRFEEAQRWYHFIFDPTDNSEVPLAMNRYRFWKVRPFFENTDVRTIEELLRLLSSTDPADKDLRKRLEDQIKDWRRNPFQPHLIAEQRPLAYQKAIVMKYLDNLIAWGDHLFRQDTRESVNEATQIYILAAEILGKQPEQIPTPAGDVVIDGTPIRTFSDLAPHLNALDNALIQLESLLPPTEPGGSSGGLSASGSFATPTNGGGGGLGAADSFASPDVDEEDDAPVAEIVGSTLFFCVPPNQKLLGYWDIVADRLFKIRHCMNIEGVERQLALFAPPIDPALLVRAAAAGIDLSSVLNDLSAPRPHYRFSVMIGKALELVNDVRALGTALLTALEKRDAEDLSLLRQRHEQAMLKAVREVRKQQIDEAEAALEGLRRNLEAAEARERFYATRNPLIPNERLNLTKMDTATMFDGLSQGTSLAASALALIPDFDLGAEGGFSSPVVKASFGGTQISKALSIASQMLALIASQERQAAQRASTLAGYDRRQEEWNFSADQARIDAQGIEHQIAAARLRIAIAERELANQELQIEQSAEIDDFMRNKFTNRDLYNWMVTQISTVYFQCYQLAYDLAKRAEKAYQHELADYSASFIKFGYWDSLKKGLLAGDRLYYDLRRMEAAYYENNKRELELTRHISLAQIDPAALIQLRETGECEFEVPEALFNLDFPGHYLRRIRWVEMTIPCVAGPYAGVNATLTLLSNRIRVSTVNPHQPYTGVDDVRFITNTGGIQSVALSSGRNDSGLFQLSTGDERYLPFEGAGAISRWRVQLTDEYRAFDYDTISDVVLHMHYTARDGGQAVRSQVVPALDARINAIVNATEHTGLYAFFSLKREFGTAFHQLLHPAGAGDHQTALALGREHFPYLFQGRTITVERAILLLKPRDPALYDDAQPLAIELARGDGAASAGDLVTAGAAFGGLPHAEFANVNGDLEVSEDWTLHITPAAVSALPAALRTTVSVDGTDVPRLRADRIEDLGLLVHYTLDAP